MKTGSSVNRVDARSITGSGLAQILIGNGLNGRDATQHLIMVLAHLHHIIERTGLDIKLLREHIHFLRSIHHQIGIGHIHQMFVTVCTAVSCLTDSRGNRVGLEYYAIQIIIALLHILQYSHSLVHSPRKDVILRLKPAVFFPQFLLGRRTENQQQYDKAAGSQPHTEKQPAQYAQRPLPDGRINSVVSLCPRIINVVNFAHRE